MRSENDMEPCDICGTWTMSKPSGLCAFCEADEFDYDPDDQDLMNDQDEDPILASAYLPGDILEWLDDHAKD